MTLGEFLSQRAGELTLSETPYLDASLILAKASGVERTRLLASLSLEAESVPASFWDMWSRRLGGESVAYILGEKEFYGRRFAVDSRVLVPRPDTETLVVAVMESGDALASRFGSGRKIAYHDACTGSGAVAVTIAAERPFWEASASDLSQGALEVAAGNAVRLLGKEIPHFRSDLLAGLVAGDGVPLSFDLISANPPYVPSAETDALLDQGWGEPRMALDGGSDGLSLVRRLVAEALTHLRPRGWLLIEVDALQIREVGAIFKLKGFGGIRVWKDLAGRERVIGAAAPPES